MERTLRKAGKQPIDPVRWRTMQTHLDKAERELRRTEIAERRLRAQSRWARRQVDQLGSSGARRRPERAAREDRRDSRRRQQALRDAARTVRTLKESLGDLTPGSRRRLGL
jgi:hypothetical protein